MTRLVARNGAVVDVADEKAKRLIDTGEFTAEKKPPAKKSASSSKSEK